MRQFRKKPLNRLTSGLVTLLFSLSVLMPGPVFAQQGGVWAATGLPVPGSMVEPSAAYAPVLLKGVRLFAGEPLRFDFIVDTGEIGAEGGAPEIKTESRKLIKYFLAALTVPERDLWVNLSPYEQDRIIPEGFGDTEMGRDLLAQDYLLKQLTGTLMYPEEEIGEAFWTRVYKEAYERYGTTDIPVNTFNKVWIVPEKAVVYENAGTNTAFVVESRLKVMLEADYVAMRHNNVGAALRGRPNINGQKDEGQAQESAPTNMATEIIRQIILPAIEKEVNEGKTFAVLRQIYHSMILAAWYKRKLKQSAGAKARVGSEKSGEKGSLLGQIYIDQNKTAGVDVEDKGIKEKIYKQYLAAFKKGVYDYIREDYDPNTGRSVPRRYFSGGVAWLFGQNASSALTVVREVSFPIRKRLFEASSGFVIVKALLGPSGAERPVVGFSSKKKVPARDKEVKETKEQKNRKTEEQNLNDGGGPSRSERQKTASSTFRTVGASSTLNREKERTLQILHLTMNLLRRKEAEKVFPSLYGELQEIFENLKKEAEEKEGISLKEAEIYLIDNEEHLAFAAPEEEVVAISTGLIRLLDEHRRLSKDTIAWILAHEIRHIVQAKTFKGESRTVVGAAEFAKELDSDLEVLDLVDRAGYNVLLAKEFFEALEEFGKTKKHNQSFIIEIIDEHLPDHKRIQNLEEKTRSSLWVNTEGKKFFGKEALEELSQSKSAIRRLEEELKEISDFSALEGLMEKYSSKEEGFKNSVFLYGILILAGKIVKGVAEKVSEEKDNRWPKKEIEEYILCDLIDRKYSERVLASEPMSVSMSFVFNHLVQESHLSQKNFRTYFKQWSGYADYEQKRRGFNKEYRRLIKETGQKPLFELFLSFLIRGSLRKDHEVAYAEFKQELMEQDYQEEAIEELKELRFYFLSLQDVEKLDINWSGFNQIRFDVALKKEADYFKKFSLRAKEYLLELLEEKEEELLVRIFNNREFMVYGWIILNSNLSEKEKVGLFLKYPFLLKGSVFNDEVLKGIFKTIYNYYLSAQEDKEKIEIFIKKEIENVPDYQRVWKYVLVPYALDAVRKKDFSLVSLWKLSAWDIAIQWDEYKKSRGLSSWEKVELLVRIIDYFSSSEHKEKEGLSVHFWEEIFGEKYSPEKPGGIFSDESLAEKLVLRSKEILKRAGMEYFGDPDKITAALIFFFSQGGFITPDSFNAMIEKIKDADNLKTLALFFESPYLENVHKKNGIERKEGRRAFFSSIALVPDEMLNNSYFYFPSSWEEMVLPVNLNVFLREIKEEPSSWQEHERLFYLSFKKIEEWFEESRTGDEKWRVSREPAVFISQQYEPLLKNLIKETTPLYAEKRDFLKSPFDYLSLFSYIFNSDLNFEELYEKISLYFPASSLRNHILFVLLLREFKKEIPDFEYQNLASLEKYLNKLSQDKKQRFLSLMEKISPLLVPDSRLTTINLALLGYLEAKIKGEKETGIGSGNRISLELVLKQKSWFSSFYAYARLFSPLGGYLSSEIESRFFKKRFLKRAEEIFRQRNIREDILAGDPSLINSIVSNYYREKILTLIYSKEEFVRLRELILKRITKLREKKGVKKENIFFFDFNHPQKPAQLDASLPFLLRSRIEERITSGNFKDALKYITTIFKYPQPARDKYLVKLREFHLEKFKKAVGDHPSLSQLKSFFDHLQEIKQHFYSPYFKKEVTLKQFALAREIRLREKGKQELALDEDLSLIKDFFPSASYSRDGLLRGLLWEVETFEDYEKVKDLFLKEGVLKEKDKLEKLFYEEKLKILFENLAPLEKKDFLLWILNIKDKPLFLREYEELFGVTFEPLKEMFSLKKEPFSFVSLSTKKFFKHSGENVRKLFIEEMFSGRRGIFNDEDLFDDFIEGLFQGIMQGVKIKGISQRTLKNIFKTTVLAAPRSKQLKIMQALGVVLARGKGHTSSYELIARFMESLGIMGVKTAQVLASSEEIELPGELKRAFLRLVSQAEPEDKQFIFETVKNLRLRMLIKKVRRVMGSGSIGVVYDVELNEDNAREIVAKVIRPEVDQVLGNDLETFMEVIKKLRKQKMKIPSGFEERVVEEIREDADFQKEKHNTDLLREQLKDFGREYHLSSGEKIEFYVPDYLASSNRKILFKEKVKGLPLNEEGRLKKVFSSEEINQIKRTIFDFIMRQMFFKGKYLADPQPGNFLIERKKDGSVRINLVDVGSVKDFSATSENIQKLLRELYFIKKGVKTQGEHIYTALFFRKLEYLGISGQQMIDWIESETKVKISRKDIIKAYLKGKMGGTASSVIQPDKSSASLSKEAASNNPGGIDLTSTGLDLETTGGGVDLQINWATVGLPCGDDDKDGICERLDEEGVREMDINGLTPVIFQIQPIGNLPLLLGIKKEEEVLEVSALR